MSHSFGPLVLLAGFAFGIVDRARHRAGQIRGGRGTCDDDRRSRHHGHRRDAVELAVGALQRRFLDVGRAARAQIIGRLQPALPGETVERVELLAGRIGDVEIERLRLVDPFLPPAAASISQLLSISKAVA